MGLVDGMDAGIFFEFLASITLLRQRTILDGNTMNLADANN